MLIPSKEKGIELLMVSIPYPHQIENIDLSYDDVIYYDWRGHRYRLGLEFCSVELSKGSVLIGDDLSILMERCLKNNLGKII